MLYKAVLFVHIAAVLWFVGGHGVAVFIDYALARERHLDRIIAYLNLSQRASALATTPGTLVITAAGLTLGFLRDWYQDGWMWAALALLLGFSALAMAVVRPHYRHLRHLVQQAQGSSEVTPEIQALLAQRNPAYVGYLGLLTIVVILYLMVFKPF